RGGVAATGLLPAASAIGMVARSLVVGQRSTNSRRYFASAVPETHHTPASPSAIAPRSSQPKWLTSISVAGPPFSRRIRWFHLASGRPARLSSTVEGPPAAIAA